MSDAANGNSHGDIPEIELIIKVSEIISSLFYLCCNIEKEIGR